MGNVPVRERRTLKDMWETLEQRTLDPIGAGPHQRQEMRRAFYGGAAAWADLMLSDMDAGEEPTKEDLAYMTLLHNEIKAFGLAIRAGLA